MIGIYKITSPSGKIYIGQSVDIEKRFSVYNGLHCKNQPILYKSFIKYSVEKHKFEILCECEILELNDKERYYQDFYSAIGKNGLNCKLTASNDKSGIFSEETKQRISQSHKGKKISVEVKFKLSEAGKKRKHSEETRNKMSKTHRGKTFSEETKIKMSEAQKGEKHYNFGKKLSEETKIKMSKSQKGKPKPEEYKNKKSKLILNIQTGIYYLGVKEAAESVNMNIGTLRGCLSGNDKNKTNFIYV
jgi:group I intron endonuclease